MRRTNKVCFVFFARHEKKNQGLGMTVYTDMRVSSWRV